MSILPYVQQIAAKILKGRFAMPEISEFLRLKVRISEERKYKIAKRAGVSPWTLSKIIHGAIPIRENDRRVVALARAVGVPEEEAFENGV